MPLSMTGFGAAEGPVAGGTLRVEIRTVNHRYFNLAAKLPGDLTAFEPDLRDRLRRDFERGQVTVTVRWATFPGPTQGMMSLDPERARQAVARLTELKRITGLVDAEISLDLIARQPDVFTAAEVDTSVVAWAEIEPVVAQAAEQCRQGRLREGAALAEELGEQLSTIAALQEQVSARAPERLIRERDRLREAVAQLLNERPVDEQRLAQEIAFLAERLDVREELVRLRAHREACREALKGTGPVGKHLGFLAQELGREVNTIGSKANDAAIQHLVVGMKGELERFREQLENLA
jgi:uncharacterized protein (TIGR00255 family)